jgi:hypothetical protein
MAAAAAASAVVLRLPLPTPLPSPSPPPVGLGAAAAAACASAMTAATMLSRSVTARRSRAAKSEGVSGGPAAGFRLEEGGGLAASMSLVAIAASVSVSSAEMRSMRAAKRSLPFLPPDP